MNNSSSDLPEEGFYVEFVSLALVTKVQSFLSLNLFSFVVCSQDPFSYKSIVLDLLG